MWRHAIMTEWYMIKTDWLCWHILSIPLKAGRGISIEACGLGDVFPPDGIGSGP